MSCCFSWDVTETSNLDLVVKVQGFCLSIYVFVISLPPFGLGIAWNQGDVPPVLMGISHRSRTSHYMERENRRAEVTPCAIFLSLTYSKKTGGLAKIFRIFFICCSISGSKTVVEPCLRCLVGHKPSRSHLSLYVKRNQRGRSHPHAQFSSHLRIQKNRGSGPDFLIFFICCSISGSKTVVEPCLRCLVLLPSVYYPVKKSEIRTRMGKNFFYHWSLHKSDESSNREPGCPLSLIEIRQSIVTPS